LVAPTEVASMEAAAGDSSQEVNQTMKRGMMNTINKWAQNFSARARSATSSLAILMMWSTSWAYPGQAQQLAHQKFPSPAEASQSLFQAVQHDNVQAIKNILGGRTELTSSGDEAQDKLDRQLFVKKYQEMHRVGREVDGTVTLYVGAENWPFPVPLVEKNGSWYFDADAGLKEVLFRRIGENELTAITICHEFVAAEKQHRPQPDTADPAGSVVKNLIIRAANESGGGDPVLFHGYYFHVPVTHPTDGVRPAPEGKTTAGFALIAYPAEYRSSGVMSFIVSDNDVVYEKDLGANTSALAHAVTTFHKDSTWHPADE
jgi:Protein of unknown function (DUF2950)